MHLGDLTVRTLASKHSPNPLGGEGVTIATPLRQPAPITAYREGGTFDFLVTHTATHDYRMLFKGSANWIPGALDDVGRRTVPRHRRHRARRRGLPATAP